jgi:peptidoglycan/LPS O-acetylase OafA/YrhL
MFGGYRFILASLVALSHWGGQMAGFNPGQWAVISFYTLSGLLMDRQFQKLSGNGNGAWCFYIDRFLRIYPVYFALLLIGWVGASLTWPNALGNLTVLPLNYYTLTGMPVLVGPAWSLACECHFYLLVPLFAGASIKTVRVVLLASLLLFVVSPFLPWSEFLAFESFPGTLFAFMSGLLVNRRDFSFLKRVAVFMALMLAIFVMTKVLKTGLKTGIHINMAIGYLFAVAAICWLDRFSPKHKWDVILGLFSYPLFLCHPMVAAYCRARFSMHNPFMLLLSAMIFSGVLIMAVERPFDRIRYKLRKNAPDGRGGRDPVATA